MLRLFCFPILLLILIITSFTKIQSQSFNTNGGVRFGNDIGISFGQRISNHGTIQLLHEIGLNQSSSQSNIHYINHMPLLSRRFNFFAGIGMHLRNHNIDGEFSKELLSYGPSATFGLDFTMGRLNIAADWTPNFAMNSVDGKKFNTTTGLSLRYVIVKRKTKFKSWRERMKDKFFKKKKKKKKS